ncbi:MAG TPA: hypothetical protein VGN20_23420 [Mucilaginibacter sp.]|jgi:hypothetical protein
MKSFFTALLFLVIAATNAVYAQKYVDKVKFFKDTSVVNATLTLNFKKIMSEKEKLGHIYPAMFSCKMGDSLNINDHVSLEVRGHFRREHCYLPPLKIIFKNEASSAFYKLKSLKLVSNCMVSNSDDQNLLKEYLVYKMYNMITDKSFRVRLLNLSYQDSSGKKKTITRHAFLIEDAKELAKRNDCVDWTDVEGKKFTSETTDRRQMTLVAMFEYMIGNTDWSVPVNHNIKVIHSKKDSLLRPFAVPYDFDFSGLVNTTYSSPDERLEIENVRVRLYRGFPRAMEELNIATDIFKKQKENIYTLINNFSLLAPYSKKEMTHYLDDFFRTINDPKSVKDVFITNARTQ